MAKIRLHKARFYLFFTVSPSLLRVMPCVALGTLAVKNDDEREHFGGISTLQTPMNARVVPTHCMHLRG